MLKKGIVFLVFLFLFLMATISVSSETNFKTVLWKYPTGGQIVFPPAVDSSGSAYFVSNDGYLYAINDKGKEMWKYRLNSNSVFPAVITQDNSIIVAIPTGLVCFAANGVLKWNFKEFRNFFDGSFSGIALSGNGDILFSAGTFIYCLDFNGKLRWTYSFPASIVKGPVIGSKGRIFLSLDTGLVYCLSPGGFLLWKSNIHFLPSVIFITSDDRLILAGHSIIALLLDGTNVFSVALPGNVVSGMEGVSGDIYISTDNGVISCYNTHGKNKWRASLKDRGLKIGCVSDSDLLLLANSRLLYKLNLKTKQYVGLRFSKRRITGVSPAGNNQLYVSSEDWNIYSVSQLIKIDTLYGKWSCYLHDPRHTSRENGLSDRFSGDYYAIDALAESVSMEDKLYALEMIESFLKGKQFFHLYAGIIEKIAGGLLSESVEKRSYYLKTVANDFPSVRIKAAETLGILGTEGARKTLVSHLNLEKNKDVIDSCIKALGVIGYDPDSLSTESIRKYLSYSDTRLTLDVVESLLRIAKRNIGKKSTREAIVILARITGDKRYLGLVREKAGKALKIFFEGK